jgi:hypothetical protein
VKIDKAFWSRADARLLEGFQADTSLPLLKRYELLFSYFVTGFMARSSADGGHAAYPGARSHHGAQLDKMEGFTRILPLLCIWLSSGRSGEIELFDGRFVSLEKVVRKGLVSGTDPESRGYWGHIGDGDQRICEASDVALSIWFLRHSLWKSLTDLERERITTWLSEVNGRTVPDNNWHLMPVQINKVLESLDCDFDQTSLQGHYDRLKSFYKGDGWFSDGPGDIYDYYNAWGIHYTLFWLDLIDREFDAEFINSTLKEFVGNYKYFFSPEGIPIMGRSIGIRMAAPAPLLGASINMPETVSPGLAQRALDCVWCYFIAKGAVGEGRVTQGYWGEDLRFVENYCGPATPLWALRSLIVAFYWPIDAPFWHVSPEPLPVEQEDYEIMIPSLRWKVAGRKESLDVEIVKLDKLDAKPERVKEYGILRRVAEMLRGRPYRPNNRSVLYNLARYGSRKPFFQM